MFPHRDGVSHRLSPRTIVTGLEVDFKTHCRVPCHTPRTPHRSEERRVKPPTTINLKPELRTIRLQPQ